MMSPAMFVFLAAGAVGLFAFLSIAAWAGSQAGERKARDRFALLKALAEVPGENAERVLALLREQEEREGVRREREERKGYLVGGLILIAVGLALGVMLGMVAGGKSGTWTVGLIPGLIGVVLTGVAVFSAPRR
jgi:hypothetical protein